MHQLALTEIVPFLSLRMVLNEDENSVVNAIRERILVVALHGVLNNSYYNF